MSVTVQPKHSPVGIPVLVRWRPAGKPHRTREPLRRCPGRCVEHQRL